MRHIAEERLVCWNAEVVSVINHCFNLRVIQCAVIERVVDSIVEEYDVFDVMLDA